MHTPEVIKNASPRLPDPLDRIYVAASILAISVAFTLGSQTREGAQRNTKSFIEACKEKHPPKPSGLTIKDYLGLHRAQYGLAPTPDDQRRSLFEITKRRQAKDYTLHPQRNARIGRYVNWFAETMANRATAGLKDYNFTIPDDEGLLEKPASKDYEGSGWLDKLVVDKKGFLTEFEITNGVRRDEYGDYVMETGSSATRLAVNNGDAEAIFTSPRLLSSDECATLPGNGESRGWRVEYFDLRGNEPVNSDVIGGSTDRVRDLHTAQIIDQQALSLISPPTRP